MQDVQAIPVWACSAAGLPYSVTTFKTVFSCQSTCGGSASSCRCVQSGLLCTMIAAHLEHNEMLLTPWFRKLADEKNDATKIS